MHVHVQLKNTNSLRKSMTTIDSSHVYMAPLAMRGKKCAAKRWWRWRECQAIMRCVGFRSENSRGRVTSASIFLQNPLIIPEHNLGPKIFPPRTNAFVYFLIALCDSPQLHTHVCPYLWWSIVFSLLAITLRHTFHVRSKIFRFFINFLCCNSWHAYAHMYYLNLNYAHVDRVYALTFIMFLLYFLILLIRICIPYAYLYLTSPALTC